MTDEPTVLDLFAGPGGWEEGVRPLGLAPRGIDLDGDAIDTARRAGHHRHRADVARTDPHDVLAWGRPVGLLASPPCQGFSASGRGRGRVDSALILDRLEGVRGPDDLDRALAGLHERMSDDRSLLALEPLRWTLALAPRWVAWEQVPAVLPLWRACVPALRAAGYDVTVGLLHTEQYGVPQTRTRAILAARLDGAARLPAPVCRRFVKGEAQTAGDPALRPWVSIRQALGWDGDGLVGFPRRADEREAVTLDGTAYRARDFRTLDEPSFAVTGKARSWLRFGMRGHGTEQLHRSTEHPAPTLAFGRDSTSWCWADEHDPRVRVGVERDRVTLAEAGVLQGFRVDYPWGGRTRHSRFGQIANAVPPPLARAIVAEVSGIGRGEVAA